MKTVSRPYLHSSSFKMAALFTLLLGVSAGILVYFLYDFGRQDFLRETEAAIDAEIHMISTIPGEANAHFPLKEYIKTRISRDGHVFFLLENASGDKLAGNIDAMPTQLERLKEGILQFTLHHDNESHLLAAKIHTLADNARVLVARDIGDLSASYERLKGLSAVIMLLMLAVVLVSFAISHFVVSRINRIAETAHDIISTHNLSRRIAIDTQWDDLSNLAQLLNKLLERVETLMTSAREVSNNIAHDLKTPLAGLRSDIESLKGGRAVTDVDLDTLIAQTDKMMSIFQSLLRITNIEQGARTQIFSPVDLMLLIKDVMELYEPVAEEKNVRLEVHCDAPIRVNGDSDLLFQLLANLLDNAVKFSPHGASITLAATQQGQEVRLYVTDQGPGIPDDEKDKVFKHFYRGDASRSTEGNGLGLSLVKAIVELHRGTITLKDANPGLTVAITLEPYQ